jgi:hypothetical protein
MLGVELLSSFWISEYYNLDFWTFCMILHLKDSENIFEDAIRQEISNYVTHFATFWHFHISL